MSVEEVREVGVLEQRVGLGVEGPDAGGYAIEEGDVA
jgi:hypothetical protein